MLDIFEIYAKLSLDSKDYDKAINDAKINGTEFATKLVLGMKEAGSAIGSVISSFGSAVVDMTKQAVDAYSNYQQLEGGVNTLFKEASSVVIENANKAFATAGLSANQYMETVTSFSASLIQSTGRGAQQDLDELEENLDKQYKETKRHWEDRIALVKDSSEKTSLKRQMEDELESLKKHNKEVLAEAEVMNSTSVSTTESLERAARLADQAIIDMSDNANKMGTSMASIQMAYQGFAKQNYTMLDNLKLGYGGTKQEMERLLQDAERIAGVKFDLSSYADIVEAIHVIQTEMGITNATYEESEKTISGSMKAVQAAWANLVTSVGGGGIEMNKAIDDLVKTAETFLRNIIPTIENALYGVGDLIHNIAPIIAEKLPELASEIIPKLVETVIYIVNQLITSLPQMIDTIANATLGMIPDLVSALIDTLDVLLNSLLPALLNVAVAMVLALGEGIANNVERIISGIMTLINAIVNVFLTNLPMIIGVGLKLILAIVEGLLLNMHNLTDTLVQLIGVMIQTFVENIPLILETGLRIGIAIAEGIVMAIPMLLISIGRFLGIVEDADKNVKKSTNNIQSSLKSTGIAISDFNSNSAKTTAETAKEVSDNATKSKQQVEAALNGLETAFRKAQQVSREYFYELNQNIDNAIEKLKRLGEIYARPQLDASGVVGACNEIVNACEAAVRALDKLARSGASTSSGSFGGGRASGGWMSAGTTYLVGEEGPELITATRDMYVHNAEETAGIFGGRGDIYITIEGDVYDDEMSMRRKLRTAVIDIMETEMA